MTAMDLILQRLRGNSLPSASDATMQEALSLAEAHHVLPSLLANLPGAARDAQRSQLRLQAFWWTCELKGIIENFRAAGVPMMPLKGPALAQRAYGATHLRSCRDLDILVLPAAIPAAAAVLHAAGFTPAAQPDDYHQTWMRGPTAVELHHGVAIPHSFHFNLDQAWAKAQRSTLEGCEILHFAPDDELIYLCLHAARHHFDRLSLVLDLHHALHRCGGRLTPALIERAERQRLSGPLLVGCGLAAKFSGDDIGEIPPPSSLLVEELWRKLTSGPPIPFSTPDLYRLYLRLETTASAAMRRRLDHLRIIATRLIPDDYDVAARLGVGPRHVHLIRILRMVRLLLRYAGRRS